MPTDPARLTLVPPTRGVPASAWHAVAGTVQRWALDSQRTACRNAMVAGTALAAHRAEREEVEAYLASHDQPHSQPHSQPRGGTSQPDLPADDRAAHA